MIHSHANDSRLRLSQLAPALVAATAFACADVLTKLTLQAGADALTLGVFRGLIGLPLLAVWLRLGARPIALSPRARWIAWESAGCSRATCSGCSRRSNRECGHGPHLASSIRCDRACRRRPQHRSACAARSPRRLAFLGLALMIGASVGVALPASCSLAAAVCRVVILLITRARLVGTDMRPVTWYSILSATAVFVLAALATLNWQAPGTPPGWSALVGSSVAMTIAVSAVFISTVRVGPFRTALFMNLEPLLATLGSAVFLGEGLTPLQGVGGAVMIAALVAFQLRR